MQSARILLVFITLIKHIFCSRSMTINLIMSTILK